MIRQIPVDYMHCICLGCVRRLLWLLTKGPKGIRLSDNLIEKLSKNLISMGEFITTEFARKPRSVLDIDRWKATESRQFLLYTGPVVFKEIIPSSKYLHFLSLSVAIRILLDEKLCLNSENFQNLFSNGLLLIFQKHTLRNM